MTTTRKPRKVLARKKTEPKKAEFRVTLADRKQNTAPMSEYHLPTDDAAIMFAYRHAKRLGKYAKVYTPDGVFIADFDGAALKKVLPRMQVAAKKVSGPALQRKTNEGRVARGEKPYPVGSETKPRRVVKKTTAKKSSPGKRTVTRKKAT